MMMFGSQGTNWRRRCCQLCDSIIVNKYCNKHGYQNTKNSVMLCAGRLEGRTDLWPATALHGLQTKPIPLGLLGFYYLLSFSLRRPDKDKKRRPPLHALLRPSSMVFSFSPSTKLYRCHLHRSSPHARRSSHAAAPDLPLALPDGVGTSAPMHGDRFLGYQLAAKAATGVLVPDDTDRRHQRKEKCWGPGAEALWPRLLLPLWRAGAPM